MTELGEALCERLRGKAALTAGEAASVRALVAACDAVIAERLSGDGGPQGKALGRRRGRLLTRPSAHIPKGLSGNNDARPGRARVRRGGTMTAGRGPQGRGAIGAYPRRTPISSRPSTRCSMRAVLAARGPRSRSATCRASTSPAGRWATPISAARSSPGQPHARQARQRQFLRRRPQARNLEGASLRRCDLRGASMRGANSLAPTSSGPICAGVIAERDRRAGIRVLRRRCADRDAWRAAGARQSGTRQDDR